MSDDRTERPASCLGGARALDAAPPEPAPASEREALVLALEQAKARMRDVRDRRDDLRSATGFARDPAHPRWQEVLDAEARYDLAMQDVGEAGDAVDDYDRRARAATAARPARPEPSLAAVAAPSPREPRAARSCKPDILVGTDLGPMVQESEEALAALAMSKPNAAIYQRGRKLVRVSREHGGAEWYRRPAGTPIIVELPRSTLTELLGAAARFARRTRDGAKAVPVPPDVVRALAERGEWPRFDHLEGVVAAPVMRRDGTILETPGYDYQTRLIYDPSGVSFPRVPQAPTLDDAKAAIDALLEPLTDFPFVGDADRAAALALVLSIVGRPAIEGPVPMFGVSAPTPGTGKGLLVDVAAIVGTGRKAPKMVACRDDDETRKRILALALESPEVICIDNVEGPLGGAALASALTAGEVKDRVLGRSETPTASLRAVWCATGNNLAYAGDLARRAVRIELDPRTERPETRAGFRHADLLAHVSSQRPALVVAALTVLRAFVVAGRPAHGRAAKGSFEGWDALVRGAVIWATGADPHPENGRPDEAGDADVDQLAALLAAWRDSPIADRAVAAADVADAARLHAPLREALAPYTDRMGVVQTLALGKALGARKNRIVGGLRLEQAGRDRNKRVLWRVVAAATA